MSRIKLDVPLMNLKGDAALKDADGDLTAQEVIADTLAIHDPQDRDGPGKAKRFLLAMRVLKEPEVELKAADIELIKKVVGMYHGPVVVGRIDEILGE